MYCRTLPEVISNISDYLQTKNPPNKFKIVGFSVCQLYYYDPYTYKFELQVKPDNHSIITESDNYYFEFEFPNGFTFDFDEIKNIFDGILDKIYERYYTNTLHQPKK